MVHQTSSSMVTIRLESRSCWTDILAYESKSGQVDIEVTLYLCFAILFTYQNYAVIKALYVPNSFLANLQSENRPINWLKPYLKTLSDLTPTLSGDPLGLPRCLANLSIF